MRSFKCAFLTAGILAASIVAAADASSTASVQSSGPFTVGGMGVYEDTIVNVNGEWLIQKREILQ